MLGFDCQEIGNEIREMGSAPKPGHGDLSETSGFLWLCVKTPFRVETGGQRFRFTCIDGKKESRPLRSERGACASFPLQQSDTFRVQSGGKLSGLTVETGYGQACAAGD